MKRLSVRLSVVGAILALGAAAIAHNVLSARDEAEERGTGKKTTVAKKDDERQKSPNPIRTEENDTLESPSTLQPPPSTFPDSGDYRTVSHMQNEEQAGDSPPLPAYGARSYPGSDESPAPPSGEFAARASVSDEPRDDDTSPPLPPAPDGLPTGGSGFPIAQGDPPPSDIPPVAPDPSSPTATGSGFPAADPTTDAGPTADSNPAPLVPGVSLQSTGPYSDRQPPDNPTAEETGQNQTPYTGESQENQTPYSAAEVRPPTPYMGGTSDGYGGGAGSPSYGPNTPGMSPQSTDPSRSLAPRVGGGFAGMTSQDMPSPVADIGASSAIVSNLPGERDLEGQQTPAITLEKIAPEEIQVDRQTTFQIRVRNVGNAPAHNVTVVDQVPRGTEFIDSVPQCSQTPDGLLIWKLDTVQPGDETVISMNLMPQVAGEIGSVAQATFQAMASVRTICTKPMLSLELVALEQVLIGQDLTLDITVTNTGNGAATNVVVEEDVPEGFTHAAGRQLEHVIGTLQPQESRRLTLVLESSTAGVFENRLAVHGDAKLNDVDIREVQVIAPQLNVSIHGPSLRYLDRQATYTLSLVNPGSASARNVELAAYLPKGMKFITSDNQGQYDSQSHAVYWSLEELPANKRGEVQVTVLPLEPGNLKLKAAVQADLGLVAENEHEVVVEGLPELIFTIADVADPIEVGSDTTYEITVQNRGSQADTDIRLFAELPPGMQPTSGDGPTKGTVQGQHVVFGSLAQLGPGEEAVFRVHATGTATGDKVVRAQLESKELGVPVMKEERTRIYSDQ